MLMNRKLGQQRLKAAEQVVAFCKKMVDDGLTHATGGNISVRVAGTEEFAISPSDRKSTRLNSSHRHTSRMPSSA